MHCCIPTSATDNNTSMGMIYAECGGGVPCTVREFHIVLSVVTMNVRYLISGQLTIYTRMLRHYEIIIYLVYYRWYCANCT